MAQVGDSGVTITVTVRYPAAAGSPAGTLGDPIDLTSATAQSLTLQRPDGSEVTLTAAVASPATAGKLTASTTSGTFSLAGLYRLQGSVTLPTGVFKTTIAAFRVGANL